jgi:hypothetical protein
MKPPVDYSDAAIDLRLRRAAQLRALCISLAAAKSPPKTAPEEKSSGAVKKPS